MITRRDLLMGAAGLAGTAVLHGCAFGQTARVNLPVGMNIAGIADWEVGFPFRNLMWGARLWLTRNVTPGGPWNTEKLDHIPLDPNGYPLEVPMRVPGTTELQQVFTLLPNILKAGRYVLLYEGEGVIEGLMNTRVVEHTPGRLILEMKHDPAGPEGIVITRSRKGNPIRNIRVVAQADEKVDLAKDPFRPEFLAFCQPFHCLRFMDWMTTNGSLEKEWSKRKRTTFYTMAGASGDADQFFGNGPSKSEFILSGGVAIEVCIDLCNRLGKDAWFCVPHRATPQYMEEFAKLVKSRLDPKLKVYLEYSNEVWNWGFLQAQWMLRSKEAAAVLEAQGLQPWENPEKSKGTLHPERTAALFRRCFAIWERVFSGADRGRLVTVCAVQHAWFDTVQRSLNWCLANGGVDAVAPAGYVGPADPEYASWEKRGASLTPEEVIRDMNTAFERDTAKWTREIATLAKTKKVQYLVYEGGQHIQPKGQADLPYMPALAKAQIHPGMYDLYMRLLRLHQEVGCQMFGAFSSVGAQGSRWGSWGHLAYYGQPLKDAPKMRALLDANRKG